MPTLPPQRPKWNMFADNDYLDYSKDVVSPAIFHKEQQPKPKEQRDKITAARSLAWRRKKENI